MISPLRLDSYVIDELSVQANPAYSKAKGEILGSIELEPEHLIRDSDPRDHQLRLRVKFCGAEDEELFPYTVEIVGRGFFHVEDEVSPTDVPALVLFNGSAILFGLLRAQVAQVTSLGPNGVFLLPAVNLVEAFRDGAQGELQPKREESEAESSAAAK